MTQVGHLNSTRILAREGGSYRIGTVYDIRITKVVAREQAETRIFVHANAELVVLQILGSRCTGVGGNTVDYGIRFRNIGQDVD